MDTARQLAEDLARLLRHEHGAMADFLLALARFDERQRWRELGHTSLFYFLHRELKLSKGAAQNRKTAAELIQAFPEVESALRSGELCLSTVNELAKVLTRENRAEVLPRFFRALTSRCGGGRGGAPAGGGGAGARGRHRRPRNRARAAGARPGRAILAGLGAARRFGSSG